MILHALILLFILLGLLNQIYAQWAEVNCETPWGETLGNTDINVGTQCHYGGGWPSWGWPACAAPFSIHDIISNPAYRVVRFTPGFNGTAIYSTDAPGNQNDWNKLVRIFSDACNNEQYYVTLGWRWNPNITPDGAIEFGLYSHINHGNANPCPDRNGEHSINLGAFIPKAVLDQADADGIFVGTEVELIFYSKGFYVRAGNRGAAIRRDFTLEADPLPLPQRNDYLGIWECPFAGTNQCETKLRRDIFFGGDERAPHDIFVTTTGWCVDCSPTWWSQTDTKLYGSSRWYSGDDQTIGASQLIRIGVNVEPQPNSEQITTFFNGTHVSFVTPNAEHDVTPEWVWDDQVAGTGHWNSSIVDAEVGAEIEFFASNVISNSGEVFDWICPGPGLPAKWSGQSEPEDGTEEISQPELSRNLNETIRLPDKIIISPNPAAGNFQVFIPPLTYPSQIIITNPLGEIIFQSKITNSTSEINLSPHPPGLYFVKVLTGDAVFVQKLVLQ